MIFLSKELKVSASYVTKKYEMNKSKSNKPTADSDSDKKQRKSFWALRGVSFDVFAGEAVGLIGTNGSGKSTLSNIIAGVSVPTTGEIVINGKTSIIAIGSGLKKALTGRENIRLKCLLSGMSNKEIDEVMDDIIAFADLDDFIDQPLKNYSSGMKSRLGFSISVHNDPDILIIDEALSVGDDTFYQRCVDKIFDFKAQGKTIFFVSHSLKQITGLCDKVIWIHDGEMKQFGPSEEVADAYKAHVKWYKELPKKEQRQYKKIQKQERQDFELDKYYQEAITFNPHVEQAKLHRMFYPPQASTKMGIGSKLMVLFLITLLISGVLFYMSEFFISFIS